MSFQEKVYKKLSEVPKGKVVTYKELAKAINSNAVRAVGTAMKNNKNIITIPCHRVVKSDGTVGQYSAKGGVSKKIHLLEKEGIEIINGKIDLNKFEFEF